MNPSFVFPSYNLDPNEQIKDVRVAQQLRNYQQSANLLRLQSQSRTREKRFITPIEAEEVVQYFKLRNFGDFNNWVQTAKGKGEYEIIDIADPKEKRTNPKYLCKATVGFQDMNIPVYRHEAEASNRKDAKALCQEKITREIIRDGWISAGFKETDFLINIRQRTSTMTDYQKALVKREELQAEQEQIQMQIQTEGGLRNINLPPVPKQKEPDLEKIKKNRIHKISKTMQDLLKEDKFTLACQELCKIINKKKPEWTEVHSIWCYGVMKKNIIYLKCILDLIQQKSYVPQAQLIQRNQNTEDKKANFEELPAQGVAQSKIDKEVADKMANEEIVRKYGAQIRLQSDNPFDVMDSYNVILNRPDLQENIQKANVREHEEQLVKNVDDLDKKMEIATFDDENQDKNDKKSQEKELSKEEPQKKIQTSTENDQKNIVDGKNPTTAVKGIGPQTQDNDALLKPKEPEKPILEPESQNESTQPTTKKGFTDRPDLEASIKYQKEVEEYLEQLKSVKDQMEADQYQQLLYYYTNVLEQEKKKTNYYEDYYKQFNSDILKKPNNQQQQQAEIKPEDYKPTPAVIPQQDFKTMQKQQEYQKSSLNQDLLKEKVLKNLTSHKRAFLVQQDEVPVIDQATAREIKEESSLYLSYSLVKEMYDQLLYCGDLNFALNIAELIYTKIKLDDTEFINSQACHYWSNKMNMIMVELLESIFQVFAQSKSKPVDFLMNINGTIFKKGQKQTQEVIIFTPSEAKQLVETKILKRGQVEGKDSYQQMAEGEFVMMTSLSGQNIQQKNLEARQAAIKTEISNLPPAPANPFAKVQQLYQRNNPQQNQFANSLRVDGGAIKAQTQTSTLLKYIDAMAEDSNNNQSEEQKAFYNTVTEQGSKSVEYAMIGYIRSIEPDLKMRIFVLPTPEQSKAISQEGRQWKITKLVNKTTHEKNIDALDIFCTKIKMSHTINQVLMTPPICNEDLIRKLSESVVSQAKQQYILNTNLNYSQQEALRKASTQALTLIQGPPGTGKTTTAVEIVLEWVRQSPQQILACADSNVAVDILHCEFQKAGLKAIRIGPGYDERNEIHYDPRYRNYKIQQHLGNKQQAMNIKYSMMKQQIESAQVICATNVGSFSEYIKELTFSRVIIDEATQSTEVSSLIPVIKGCQQVVLIGDHKQLPPTVLSTFAQSKGMTVSLFERLVKQGVRPNMLVEQYRMHPSIAVFPSHQFYNNLLQNGVGEIHRPIIQGFKWPNQYVRVAIVNVIGFEQIYSSSVQNNKEVEVVISVLLQMLKTKQVSINQVGIITPYDAQKRRIRNEINHQARKYPEFFNLSYNQAAKIQKNSVIGDVDTVDGYQGMERDVIIISTVRSNPGGNLGFLKDPRRMNVALTRAKRGLIVIGNIETLQSDENWRDLINWGKANKIIINYY